MAHPASFRSRKYVKSNSRKISFGWILLLLLSLIVLFSLLAYYSLCKQKGNVTQNESDKVLSFGHGSVTSGGDSRYWDRDDRRRDHVKQSAKSLGGDSSSVGLYMESGRDELKLYEKEFEASLKNVGQSTEDEEEELFDDEYDDAIDSNDARVADPEEVDTGKGESIIKHPMGTKEAQSEDSDNVLNNVSNDTSSRTTDEVKTDSRNDNIIKGISANTSISERETDSRRTPKRHKFAGSTCEIKFLNSTAQLVEPLESTNVSRFSLQYTDVEEKPSRQEQWEARFSGHQRLKEREESFYACDQKINCGFIKGPKGSPSTGFDLKEEDRRYMSSCRIAVSSCIFGNSDKLKSSFGKTVTHLSRKSVCFVMFVDESTLRTLSSKGQKPDKFGFVGLWKIVVVKSLPFADMRRVGKVPKFLAHRLFPSARYSIWLDSKLRLQVDPLIILEYFLWRNGYEYAISKHYSRRCVWEEVAQNKRLHKFNHTIIDQQFHFYQADGLKRYNASDPNKLLPSNVPEGSFIVRAHTPMSNLFSCLWFNEVDRFTPRDQLSFAYVYQKLRRMNPEKPFYFKMFKDCERRAIAKLFHHRSEGKRHIPSQANANA